MDDLQYEIRQEEESKKFEGACKHCGECCGALDGEACANLAKHPAGTSYCKVYETRLGLQKTVGGKIFNCVPIRELARQGRLRPGCAYQDNTIKFEKERI